MKPNTDVVTERHGSIVSLTPTTPAAREWIDENCQAEFWQWLGATLNIDLNCASDVVGGMQSAGLIVE
jgi:hypothetical protein